MRWTVLSVLLLGLAMVQPAVAATEDVAAGAEQFIETLADEAINALTESNLSKDARRDGFRAMLNDGFAVRGIARFVMGRYWGQASDEQRDEYLNLFEQVIVSVWADRFTEYSGQRFQIVESAMAQSARSDEQATLVRTLFWTSPDSPVRIDWRVASNGDLYKITDVLVEGVSMAQTYRDEFASVIRRNGVDGLLIDLRARSAN